MKILIIITGSVGCYKSLDLIRECQKKSIEYKIFSDHVTRLTFFERRSLRIKVEEIFPKKNNYPDLRLIECRGNIVD